MCGYFMEEGGVSEKKTVKKIKSANYKYLNPEMGASIYLLPLSKTCRLRFVKYIHLVTCWRHITLT